MENLQTISIILTAVYVIASTVLCLKHYKKTEIIYGKYNSLVYVVLNILMFAYFYVVLYVFEWHIYNSITLLISIITSYRYIVQGKLERDYESAKATMEFHKEFK